jgi:hypothetical protein
MTQRLRKVKCKFFIKKYLGDSFESDMLKSEVGAILKPDANANVLPHEMYVSLQIVPRTVISLLVQKLKPLKPGQHTDIAWPTDSGAIHNIHINKISSDLYSGEITGEGKVLAKFGYRSLPAVGLVIMSTYELYDKETNKQDLQNPQIDYDKVQRIIDERIRMQALVEDVVSRKLSERDALQQLIMQRINDYLRVSESIKQKTPQENQHNNLEQSEYMEEHTEEESDEPEIDEIDVDKEVIEEVENTKKDKKNKLKDFLNKKVKKTESVKILKQEIKCPYCSTTIFKGGDSIDLCVCFGEDFGNSIKIKKNKNNEYTFKYPKNFSIDNATMLLGFLKKK